MWFSHRSSVFYKYKVFSLVGWLELVWFFEPAKWPAYLYCMFASICFTMFYCSTRYDILQGVAAKRILHVGPNEAGCSSVPPAHRHKCFFINPDPPCLSRCFLLQPKKLQESSQLTIVAITTNYFSVLGLLKKPTNLCPSSPYPLGDPAAAFGSRGMSAS